MKLFFVFLLTIITCRSTAQEAIPLYNVVPGAIQSTINERTVLIAGGAARIYNVTEPTLTVFYPAKANGTAVIICPGGGYARLAMDNEGYNVARALTEWGITAFVLKYRLPNDTIMKQKELGPLQDAQRAIQLVKEQAGKWNIDTNKVGIMGFSAGGHLASTLSTHFNINTLPGKSRVSLRPAFQVLGYPVISFTDSLCHMGSRNNLIGKQPSMQSIMMYSNELQVDTTTPPAFILHAADDKSVKVQNSLSYYQALVKNNVLAELHVYPRGGHGFGMNNSTTSDKWMDRLHNWLLSYGFINE